MKKITTIFICLLALMMSTQAEAESFVNDLQYKFRVGYNIGGTAPVGLPEEIRRIDGYKLTPSFLFGVDVQKPLGGKWGLLVGVHFEGKNMNADATAKAYHMKMKKGDSELEGLFTGKVHQEVTEWMFTIPVQATYTFNNKLQVKAGPYMSILTAKDFDGIASDGYIRQGGATGAKVLIGNKEGEWATYNFKDDMRTIQVGLAAGLDWSFYRNFGLSVDLNWGLNGIFKKDFKVIDNTLFPIYGTIGFFYHLK